MIRILTLLLLVICTELSNAQVNLSSGLVAYYPFNGTFNDASGNGNHGTGHNGVSFGTDQWGNPNNCAVFDGVDDWVSILPSLSTTPGKHLSISLRFMTYDTVRQFLVAKAEINTYNNFCYNVEFNDITTVSSTATGMLFGSAHEGTCSPPTRASNNYLTTGIPILAKKWYCIVVTFDSGAKNIFVNGTLLASQIITGVPFPHKIDSCRNAGLKLGTWCGLDPAFFKGVMDEVRIYNRTLNSQEIDSLCKLVIKPTPPSLSVINKYAAVVSAGPCGNSFLVDSSQGFKPGDTILMIQMKGADIDSSNSQTFGTISNYNGAGNYEKNVIKSVSGNIISLLYKVQRNYDIPQGKVQFVTIPSFKNYSINHKLKAKPWNGVKGGVFALNVENNLYLSDSIDVSGQGFRGGKGYRATYSSNVICNYPDYFNPPNIDSSAQKGEGISNLSIFRSFARGAAANGGGGGNAHNAGGGGGSNGGTGGIGGRNYAGCPPTTANVTGGMGGVGLAIAGSSNRIFLGGGGGAGHSNDQTNSDGGSGGGIVFLHAGNIVATNGVIVANGIDGALCTNIVGAYPCTDGMGGGGAGGTILVDCNSISGNIEVGANGGHGADVIGSAAFSNLILGPGGGGGGGALWVSPLLMPTAISFSALGGRYGVNINQFNNAMDAQSGNSGLSISNLKISSLVDTFKDNALTIDFSFKLTGCYKVQFTPLVNWGTSYNWTFASFGNSLQKDPEFVFPGEGVYQVTLSVIDSTGCVFSVTKSIQIFNYKGSSSDSTICSGNSIQLNETTGKYFSWSPAYGLNNTTKSSVVASPMVSTTYYVAVSDGKGCDFSDTFNVIVIPTAIASFSYSPNPPQANTPILFQSSGANVSKWLWDFGDGSTSSVANPSHLFLKNGYFNVCLIVSNDGNCPDTICQTVQAVVKKFVGIPTAFTPNGDHENDLLLIRGSGIVSVHLVIFNRWGQRVFETADLNQGWDGTFRGQAQDIDVFAYVLSAKFIDGSSETKKGNINLLR